MTSKQEEQFWERQRPESRIKALLVSDYFPQYCKILEKGGKGGGYRYLDFWAGRGVYKDGNLSTPFLLGDIIAKDPMLNAKVTMVFNDLNNAEFLENNWHARYSEGTFKNRPRFGAYDAESSDVLRKFLNRKFDPKQINNPALLFFDPFGYAGIDTASLANFLIPFGNELFLFMNVNRVIPALTNPKVPHHIEAMFPKFKDQAISEITAETKDEKKVSVLLKFLEKEFRVVLGKRLHMTSFKFMEDGANKTSHLIIHFCKHDTGFKLIKTVFCDYDNIGAVLNKDGTYTFDAKKAYGKGIINFDIEDNDIILAEELAKTYAGRTITAAALLNEHHPKANFAPNHYSKALRRLVEQGRLTSTFTDKIDHEKSVILSIYCHLKFPPNV